MSLQDFFFIYNKIQVCDYDHFLLWVFMKLLRTFLYLASIIVICVPLIILICHGVACKTPKKSSVASENVVVDVCLDGDLNKCLKAKDDSLAKGEYVQAFSYMRKLCEDFKKSDACFQLYSTYNAIKSETEIKRSAVRVTLYEVIYYLDIGCKLNNYDACMRAGMIYEHGVKPGDSQNSYSYNIAYDPQEAKRYYKKVCSSISDKAEEACMKIEELSHTYHSLTD